MIEHVLFLRHFETLHNAEKRICGRSLEVPVLRKPDILCDIPVDFAICSPAVRCVETLDAFLRHSQVSSVSYDSALVERDMGRMEGQLRSEMAASYPELFSGNKFRLYQTPPDGETFEAFHNRVKIFWEQVNMKYNGTLLVCSHNQFMKMLYLVVHGIPITETAWRNLSFQHGIVEQIK